MPRIPDYTAVGTLTPQPAYRRPVVNEAGETVARAVEGLGTSLEQGELEQHNRDVNFARAQSSNAMLDNQLAVKSQVEQIRQQVTSGQLPWNQAGPAFDQWVGQQQRPDVENLDPVGQVNLDKGIKRNIAEGQQAVLGITQTGQKQAFADQFDQAQDKLGKLAGLPDADIGQINSQMDAYRPMALEAGIPAANVDKAIQNFKDRNWLNQATQRSMEAKDDMGQLQQLQHDLTDADGFYAGKLDTDKRNIVLRGVINDQLILQSRLQHEQDKREAKAQATLGRIDEQISSGIPATPQMWDQWESVTKGTTAESEFQQRLQDETQVQDVLRQPIDQQIKYVQDKVTSLEQNGGTLRDRANVMRLQTAVQQNVNLLQRQPLIFQANRNGAEVAPLDFSSIGSQDGQQAVATQVADRMATLEAMRNQYGPQVSITPLLPQEASQLTAQLQQATPLQRAQLLTSVRSAFNNDDAYQAAMRQIAPRSPVTAIAGSMIGASSPASTPVWFDKQFAPQLTDTERVLRGEGLLNPAAAGGKEATQEQESGKGALKGGMPMPDDKLLRVTYGQAASGLFPDRPQLADAYYSVFKSAYAALLAEKGDMKGVGDGTLERQALKIALGNTVDFNGSQLSVPAGMDPTRFDGLVRNAVSDAATSMKAPPDWQDRIRGYQLREVGGLGSGRYELMNGNVPFVRPDHKGIFTIDLRNQYLPGTPGAQSGSTAGIQPSDPFNKVAMSAAAGRTQ
jgi:hypothetical protein